MFDENEPDGKALLEWWSELQGYQGDSLERMRYEGLKPGAPGLRAELRRAGNETEVVFCRGYQQLKWALPTHRRDDRRLPAVARVLAWVKDLPDARLLNTSLPSCMGQRKSENDETPLVGELRFKRLLRVDDRQELADLLIRLLPLMQRTANPLTLARAIWFWGDGNDRTRKDWANDYYHALLG